MAASIFESPLLSKRFPTGEAGRLFTDAAEVRALLLVAGSLAKVQGEMGLIPEDSAFFIHRSAMEVQIDPAGLARGVTSDADVVRHMAKAFAEAMEAPEHAQYILTDAEPKDIAQIARTLRLRQLLTLCEKALAQHDDADFAAQVAKLPTLRARCLVASFGPAAQSDVRAKLAKALRLQGATETSATPEEASAEIANWLVETVTFVANAKGPRAEDRQALAGLAGALGTAVIANPRKMITLCLPQIALCCASALGLLINPTEAT